MITLQPGQMSLGLGTIFRVQVVGGAVGTERGGSTVRIRDGRISNVDFREERIEGGVPDGRGQTECGDVETDTARSARIALARIAKTEFTDEVGAKRVRIAQCGNPGSSCGIAFVAIGAFSGKGDIRVSGCISAGVSDTVTKEETIIVAYSLIDPAVIPGIQTGTCCSGSVVIRAAG